MQKNQTTANIIGNLNNGDASELTTHFNQPSGSIIGTYNTGSNNTITTNIILPTPPSFDEQHTDSVFNFPHSTCMFIDRKEKLHELSSTLSQNKFTGHIINLHGYGGVGKTTLLHAYLQAHSQEFSGKVFCFSAGTKEKLLDGFASLATHIPCDAEPAVKLVSHIKQWFNKRREWLIVIDDIPDIQNVWELLPLFAHGTLLLLSRTQIIVQGQNIIHIPLDVFCPDESINFMLNRLNQPSSQDILKITEELSHFPLALEHCCSLILARGDEWTAADFLKEYSTQRHLINDDYGDDIHMRSINAIWQLTYQSLTTRLTKKNIQHLLKLVLFFSLTNLNA